MSHQIKIGFMVLGILVCASILAWRMQRPKPRPEKPITGVVDTGYRQPVLHPGGFCNKEGAVYPAGPKDTEHKLVCHAGELQPIGNWSEPREAKPQEPEHHHNH